MIAPAIEELAEEFAGSCKVVKFNIEENPAIPTQYGVMSIPTLMFFKDGKIMDQVGGALNKSDLKKRVDANLV
jgi:thioredoxin 1